MTTHCDLYDHIRKHFLILQKYLTTAPPLQAPLSASVPDLQKLQAQIRRWVRKPNVILTGAFDVGKTHLANTLLGEPLLPADYTPCTRLVTLVMHREARPDSVLEDVIILKRGCDLARIAEGDDFAPYVLSRGGASLLFELGTLESRNVLRDAYAAIVYHDAPILLTCNLVDLPGFDDTEEDEQKAKEASSLGDILLYLSTAKGFLRAEDFVRLSYLVKQLSPFEVLDESFPTLGNCFIVASQADPSINLASLERILDRGSERLWKYLSEGLWKERQQVSQRTISLDVLRQRMFYFWTDDPVRRERFEYCLQEILFKAMPTVFLRGFQREVTRAREYGAQSCRDAIEAYNKILLRLEEAGRELIRLQSREPARRIAAVAKREKFRRLLSQHRTEVKDFIQVHIRNRLLKQNVEQFIRDNFTSLKEAQAYAPVKYMESIQAQLQSVLASRTKQLMGEVEDLLGLYRISISVPQSGVDIEEVAIPFDVKGAFTAGLAGAGALGAMAAWAASLGNLGGYILVAKAVSVLTGLGISLGGTASAVSAVAALGGPVVIAIGLATLVGIGVRMLFGESWQARLAGALSEELLKRRVIETLTASADRYWAETEAAFDAAFESLETRYQEYVYKMEEVVSGAPEMSREKIEEILQMAEELRDFFEGMPLAAVGCTADNIASG